VHDLAPGDAAFVELFELFELIVVDRVVEKAGEVREELQPIVECVRRRMRGARRDPPLRGGEAVAMRLPLVTRVDRVNTATACRYRPLGRVSTVAFHSAR
jgi:hypothetical protein